MRVQVMLPLLYQLFFQGGAGVTGAKSSDFMGVGVGAKVPTAHQEQFGIQYLAQGYFSM